MSKENDKVGNPPSSQREGQDVDLSTFIAVTELDCGTTDPSTATQSQPNNAYLRGWRLLMLSIG